MTTPSKSLIFIAIFTMPLFTGLLFITGWDVWKGVKSHSMNETTGRILSFDVKRGPIGLPAPAVRFMYAVEGKRYLSNHVWAGTIANYWPLLFPGEIRALTMSYPIDTYVPVFVDPQSPENAVLIQGARIPMRWTALLILLMGVNAGLLFLKPKKRKASKRGDR